MNSSQSQEKQKNKLTELFLIQRKILRMQKHLVVDSLLTQLSLRLNYYFYDAVCLIMFLFSLFLLCLHCKE